MIKITVRKGSNITDVYLPDEIDLRLITDDKPIAKICEEIGITTTSGYKRIQRLADRLKLSIDKNSVPKNMYYPVLRELIKHHPVFWDLVEISVLLQIIPTGDTDDKLEN